MYVVNLSVLRKNTFMSMFLMFISTAVTSDSLNVTIFLPSFPFELSVYLRVPQLLAHKSVH